VAELEYNAILKVSAPLVKLCPSTRISCLKLVQTAWVIAMSYPPMDYVIAKAFVALHAYIHLFDAFLVALSSTLEWHVDMIVRIIAAFPLVPSRI
jgi:hypothetical protein